MTPTGDGSGRPFYAAESASGMMQSSHGAGCFLVKRPAAISSTAAAPGRGRGLGLRRVLSIDWAYERDA